MSSHGNSGNTWNSPYARSAYEMLYSYDAEWCAQCADRKWDDSIYGHTHRVAAEAWGELEWGHGDDESLARRMFAEGMEPADIAFSLAKTSVVEAAAAPRHFHLGSCAGVGRSRYTPGWGQSDWMKEIQRDVHALLHAARLTCDLDEKPNQWWPAWRLTNYEESRRERRAALATLNLPWCREYRSQVVTIAEAMRPVLTMRNHMTRAEDVEQYNNRCAEHKKAKSITMLLKIREAI